MDRKEVMFGKVDQMSREEVEKRLEQLMGNVVLADSSGASDPGVQEEDEALSLERLEQEDAQSENLIDDLDEVSSDLVDPE